MRSFSSSFGATLLLSIACSQVIGLDDYAADGESGGSGDRSGGGPTRGGEAGESVGGTGGSTAEGGAGRGGAGAPSAGETQGGGAGENVGGSSGGAETAGAGGVVPTATGGGAGAGGSVGVDGDAGAGGSAGGGGQPCEDIELLEDGEFDLLSPTWEQFSYDNADLVVQRTFARTGSYVGRIGGANGLASDDDEYYSDLYQTFALPYNTTSLTSTCWYRIDTEEADDGVKYDRAYLSLYDANNINDSLVDFADFSNLDATATWTKTSLTVDASFYASKRVTFDLLAFNDSEAITNFYFDSCSLVVTTCE